MVPLIRRSRWIPVVSRSLMHHLETSTAPRLARWILTTLTHVVFHDLADFLLVMPTTTKLSAFSTRSRSLENFSLVYLHRDSQIAMKMDRSVFSTRSARLASSNKP